MSSVMPPIPRHVPARCGCDLPHPWPDTLRSAVAPGPGLLPSLLIAGGLFSLAERVEAKSSPRTTQSPVSGRPLDPASTAWSALATHPNGDLVAGGDFRSTSGQLQVNAIAAWDGQSWSTFRTGMGGVSSPIVDALAEFPGVSSSPAAPSRPPAGSRHPGSRSGMAAAGYRSDPGWPGSNDRRTDRRNPRRRAPSCEHAGWCPSDVSPECLSRLQQRQLLRRLRR